MEKIVILDQQRIHHKLQRMAYQIWEHNSNEEEVILVGIEGTGLAVAKDLAKRLSGISSLQVGVVSLRLNKKSPLTEAIVLDQDLSGKSVVLVDDVANSGKTLLFAMKPMLEFEAKKILIAVLVDRKHKSFPISPDIIGYSLATTLHDHIEVSSVGENIAAVYLT